MMSEPLTYLGYANADRSYGRPIALLESDRFSHLYLIGRTGTGKSHLLRLIALQDIKHGRGLAMIDPHGDMVEALAQDTGVRVLDASKSSFRFNPLQIGEGTDISLTVAMILSVFHKLWEDNWGPRLEHLLRHVLYTMIANEEATLSDIPRLLVDKDYRQSFVRNVADLVVKRFWADEYDKYTPGFRSVVIAPLQNKLGALLTDARLRTILTDDPRSTEQVLNFERSMNCSEVLLFDLSKGKLGEGPSALLGGFLSAHLVLAGLSRASVATEKRSPFFIYLDEYPAYSTALLSVGLSELRKYRVGITLAHQYFAQLTPFLRDAALGNVGSIIAFRVGAPDAPLLSREFDPTFSTTDLISLPNYTAYTRLMVDGEVTRPFSFKTYTRLASAPRL